YLNLYQTDEMVEHEVRGMFTVNTNININPDTVYKTEKMCSPSHSLRLVAMTGHFHARGVDFMVDHVPIDSPDTIIDPVYRSGPDYEQGTSWDAPLFKIYDQPPLISAGSQGLHFACSYYNDSSVTGITNPITFGGHADVQEH